MLHQAIYYIKQQLRIKKISYKMLSQRTNISLSQLKKIFSGRKGITISDMEKIIKVANIDNVEIIQFNNETEQELFRLIRQLSEDEQYGLYKQLKEKPSS